MRTRSSRPDTLDEPMAPGAPPYRFPYGVSAIPLPETVYHPRPGCDVSHELTSEGTSISRLRILPVGPFGSSSTNHTLRGYL
jgi:hypothetical protein